MNDTAEYLAQYGRSDDHPALSETVSEDDLTFRIARVMLPRDCATWESGAAFVATDKLSPRVAQALEDGVIQPAVAYWVRDLCCPGCSGNYLSCQCTTLLERNAYVARAQKCAYLYWADQRVSMASSENRYESRT